METVAVVSVVILFVAMAVCHVLYDRKVTSEINRINADAQQYETSASGLPNNNSGPELSTAQLPDYNLWEACDQISNYLSDINPITEVPTVIIVTRDGSKVLSDANDEAAGYLAEEIIKSVKGAEYAEPRGPFPYDPWEDAKNIARYLHDKAPSCPHNTPRAMVITGEGTRAYYGEEAERLVQEVKGGKYK